MKQFVVFLGVCLLFFAAGIEANILPIVNATSVCSSKAPCELRWTNDANLPPVAKLPVTDVELMVGSNDNQISVKSLGIVNPKVGKLVYNIPPNLGPPGKFYFYRFTPKGPLDPIWSTRFLIRDINGTIPGFDPKSVNGSGDSTTPPGLAGPDNSTTTGNSTEATGKNPASSISANIALGLSMAAMAAVSLY